MTASLSTLITGHAVRGQHPALVHDGRTWTYPELASAAGALAARMAEAGLAGERVAMMLPNSPDTVLTYLACFASGAVAAPLNSRYAPRRSSGRCAAPRRPGSSRTRAAWTCSPRSTPRCSRGCGSW